MGWAFKVNWYLNYSIPYQKSFMSLRTSPKNPFSSVNFKSISTYEKIFRNKQEVFCLLK